MCEHANDPVDFCHVSDIPIFTLCNETDDRIDKEEDSYAELGIWMGLPPGLDTHSKNQQLYFPGIHVHARKHSEGPKLVDKNFPAVTVRDRTLRYPHLSGEGVTITSPAALEYLFFMEHSCPVNRNLASGKDDKNKTAAGLLPDLPRSKVDLVSDIRCKNCNAIHEDIGDFFGETKHKKHLCGQCGRAIMGKANIGNPMYAFQREFHREVVAGKNARIELSSKEYTVTAWPSTPAILFSRSAAEPWGIHIHAFDKDGKRVIDDTFGEVSLDGKKLNRADLFNDMVKGIQWLQEEDAAKKASTAEELEDD